MTCNYFEYRDMTEKLFFGTLLTQEHLNRATEEICERKVVVNYGLITRQSQSDGMEKKIEEQIIDVALLPEKHTVVSV